MRRFLTKLMSNTHVFWYRLSGGALGGKMMGAPILLLTTIGRKTGKARTAPLMFVEDGDDLADLFLTQRTEHDQLIDAVQEFRAHGFLQLLKNFFLGLLDHFLFVAFVH